MGDERLLNVLAGLSSMTTRLTKREAVALLEMDYVSLPREAAGKLLQQIRTVYTLFGYPLGGRSYLVWVPQGALGYYALRTFH